VSPLPAPDVMLSSMNRGKRQHNENTFLEDLRFAREYELAWLLRWALSRVVRIKEGSHERLHGVIEWEIYEEWRGRERGRFDFVNHSLC